MNQNDVTHLFFDKWSEKNAKIVHHKRGLIEWKMYPYMNLLDAAIEENKFVIVNKFRQSGISTFTVIRALWQAIWKLDQSILFLAKTDREARALNRIARTVLDHLPEQPHIGFVKPSKCNDHEITFEETNSRIWFYSPEPARGRSVTHLYIDEAAFIRNMDNVWRCVWPVLSRGGSCTVSSTPNRADGWFYETFNHAFKKENSFYPIHLNWKDHPEYGHNPEWEVQMLENLGPKGFLSEIAGVFLFPHSRENDLYKTKMDELEEKEKKIYEVIKEYNQVVERVESLISQPMSGVIDGKLKVLTPEAVEVAALRKALEQEKNTVAILREELYAQERVAERGYMEAYKIIMDLRNKVEEQKEIFEKEIETELKLICGDINERIS